MYIIYSTYTGYVHAAKILNTGLVYTEAVARRDTRTLRVNSRIYIHRAGNTKIWQFVIMKWKKYFEFFTYFIQFYKSVTKQRLKCMYTFFLHLNCSLGRHN